MPEAILINQCHRKDGALDWNEQAESTVSGKKQHQEDWEVGWRSRITGTVVDILQPDNFLGWACLAVQVDYSVLLKQPDQSILGIGQTEVKWAAQGCSLPWKVSSLFLLHSAHVFLPKHTSTETTQSYVWRGWRRQGKSKDWDPQAIASGQVIFSPYDIFSSSPSLFFSSWLWLTQMFEQFNVLTSARSSKWDKLCSSYLTTTQSTLHDHSSHPPSLPTLGSSDSFYFMMKWIICDPGWLGGCPPGLIGLIESSHPFDGGEFIHPHRVYSVHSPEPELEEVGGALVLWTGSFSGPPPGGPPYIYSYIHLQICHAHNVVLLWMDWWLESVLNNR